MTIYENTMGTYQIVESPLSGQFEQYEAYPHPNQQYPATVSPHQLMVIIVGLVLLLGGLGFRFLPGLVTVEADGGETAVTTTNTSPDQSGTDTVGQAAAGAVNGSTGISPIFSPQVQYWASQIVAWAKPFGLDPDIVATIMQIESCGDPQAVSHAGAQGLFQVMPFHFTAGEVMLDPDTNARRGMAYYAERLQQTSGNVFQAFAGYNGGHVAAAGNWSTWANETQRYYTWSKGIYEDAKSGAAESETLQQWMQAGGVSLCQQASARIGLQ